MMILLHLPQFPISITLFFSIYISSFAFGFEDGSFHCNKTIRTCGNTSLSYPFGFSNSCPISLNCSAAAGDGNGDGTITIGEFQVQNVTSDSILVRIPMNCSRSNSDIYTLIGNNYAIDRQNVLLFEDCNSPPEKCLIPEIMSENNTNFQSNCIQNFSNINCYTFDNGTSGFISKEDFQRPDCRILITSVAVDIPNTSNFTTSSPVSLRFQSLKLGWWVTGNCNCSENATCFKVITGKEDGYRCRCLDGFEGDGFAGGGVPCRKVKNCPKGFSVGHCGESTKTFILIGGIVLGAALMAITAFLFFIIKRRSKSLKTQKSAKRLLHEVAGNSTVHLYAYKEIEKATNFFSEKQRLGTGAYGTVYAGKVLKNDEWVAIKKIRNRDSNGIEQVMNEIKLLSSVSHRNLLRLLGCCIEKGEQILVYEFMPNGTLSEHLQGKKGKPLTWTTRLTIATETAQAIAYLHSAMNPPIFHRDIKSSNILLDHNFKSKVADFGLSRFGMENDSYISTAPQGTPGYVDPQYHQNFQLSDKSDVYSFGVVLMEIITGMKAIDFSRPHTEVNLAALAVDRIGHGQLDNIIDPFLDLDSDACTLSSIHKVAELAFRCLAYHRDMRPSMMEVAEELDQIRLNAWASMDDTNSSTTFACSSPFNGSEKSNSSGVSLKIGGVTSKMLFVRQRLVDCLVSSSEGKDDSPVSVQDSWKSEQTSPSANSLLRNVVQ
ncbi:wall-associated receptor kinase-like 14 [Impatiens glandulifera]|uniref:wall-associated receptor kinase-like 14 n=1 Tax=Impatiens glandulifera TaxID=253017 RepID=UPI001FB067E7|nr:wall-associated receptor kinase-like 14 [Impatiens glandulifera]